MGEEHVRQLVAVVTTVGICILAAGCHNTNSSTSKTSTTTSTTTTKAPPPVAQGSLKGFLLSPDQVNAAMGAKDMTVTKSRTAMSDDSASMTPKECLAIDGAVQAQVYAGGGVIAVRDQTLQEGDNFAHFAEQAVVLFPSAKQAGAFFATQGQQWQTCHDYTHVQSQTQWSVEGILNVNGMLSTIATQENANSPGWACGRALAVRNNVIIDVNTCSADPKNSAVDLANQIAAKIPA
ncbi:MAG: sensor domain-containing protein [Mycobacteriaceae bacterium]|nr:sensor domain-containing protein [Mycobacteriaceae bacterium]